MCVSHITLYFIENYSTEKQTDQYYLGNRKSIFHVGYSNCYQWFLTRGIIRIIYRKFCLDLPRFDTQTFLLTQSMLESRYVNFFKDPKVIFIWDLPLV